jgi:MFS transporter, ACS family, D-galactonate transporter
MPCRRTADVVGYHSLRVRCEYLCRARARFAIAHGGPAFTGAVIRSLPEDVAPTPGHVASIGGVQNLAGIRTTTVTGARLRVRVDDLQYP